VNQRFLQVLGLLALVALVLGSLGALAAVRTKLSITIAEGEAGDARGPDPVALLVEDVAALREDVVALSEGLGQGLTGVHDALEQASTQRHAALAAEVAALRRDLARLEGTTAGNEERGRRLAEGLARVEGHLAGLAGGAVVQEPDGASGDWTDPLPGVADGARPEGTPVDAEPEPPVPADPAPVAPEPAGRSFLSFSLPSQAFAFDRPQRLEVQGSLSRVGFDAKSTLHDFSGVTSSVEGTLETCLARPGELCRGTLSVQASALDTGDEARDEAMLEHLAAQQHPQIAFEWSAFEAEAVDAEAMTVRGTARGRMSVRGVTRDFAMPVTVSVDKSRRVAIEGEAPLDLRDYEVPVPNKLGVISMESEVRVWIALRLRAVGPVVEEREGGR